MLGRSLRDVVGVRRFAFATRTEDSIKATVFQFNQSPLLDVVLGPEMRSRRGMGLGESSASPTRRRRSRRGSRSPPGNALVSVTRPRQARVVPVPAELSAMGFKLFATIGTHEGAEGGRIPSVVVSKTAAPRAAPPFLPTHRHRRPDLSSPPDPTGLPGRGTMARPGRGPGIPLTRRSRGRTRPWRRSSLRSQRSGAIPVQALQDYARACDEADGLCLGLEDGTVFAGEAFGATGTAEGEVVFNTAMTGYQEILTDPSYCGQIVTMTAPQIGNYGVNREDVESRGAFLAGFVVKELSRRVSNQRAAGDLASYLRESGVIGLAGIDTRALHQATARSRGPARRSQHGNRRRRTLVERAAASPR